MAATLGSRRASTSTRHALASASSRRRPCRSPSPPDPHATSRAQYDEIEVETSDGCPPAVTTFAESELPEAVLRNVELCKFTKPTPIQKYAIPVGLAMRDMMACAQTGSGKTGGFLFPAVARMIKEGPADVSGVEQTGGAYGRAKAFPTAMVLAPTRELASQIYDEAQKFCYCTGLRPVVVYGGAPVRDQLMDLERGCDLLVGTPGRLVDIIERGRVSLAGIKCEPGTPARATPPTARSRSATLPPPPAQGARP